MFSQKRMLIVQSVWFYVMNFVFSNQMLPSSAGAVECWVNAIKQDFIIWYSRYFRWDFSEKIKGKINKLNLKEEEKTTRRKKCNQITKFAARRYSHFSYFHGLRTHPANMDLLKDKRIKILLLLFNGKQNKTKLQNYIQTHLGNVF